MKQMEESQITLDDFSNFMSSLLTSTICGKTNFVAITGVGGYLQISWKLFGRQKLPRKLKKRVYLTHKLRKQYLPEYYGK